MDKEKSVLKYLEDVRFLKCRIRILRDTIAAYKDITPSFIREHLPSDWVDPMEGLLSDFELEAKSCESDLVRAQATISQLEYPQGDLLAMRYLDGKGWQAIGRELMYNPDYCRTGIHKKAIRNLYEYIPSEYKK